MIRIRLLAIAITLGLGLPVAPAEAQLARTFVSSLGNDANDCGRATPCRTLQRAHDNTLALGEITVLDPGGYGAVTITKGISIINDGVGEAGVLVSGGLVGITVNAGVTGRVSLRGLTIKGIGFGGGNGIVFTSGKSLTIENCAIRNLTLDAVQMAGNLPANTETSFTMTNTLVADSDANGIYIQPSGGGRLKVLLNRVEVYNNGAHGIAVAGHNGSNLNLNAVVTDSVSSNNGLSGVIASSALGGSIVEVHVARSTITYNATGLSSVGVGLPALAQVTVGGSIVRDNAQGYEGIVISYGDNAWSNGDFGNPGFTAPRK